MRPKGRLATEPLVTIFRLGIGKSGLQLRRIFGKLKLSALRFRLPAAFDRFIKVYSHIFSAIHLNAFAFL